MFPKPKAMKAENPLPLLSGPNGSFFSSFDGGLYLKHSLHLFNGSAEIKKVFEPIGNFLPIHVELF